MQPKWKVEQYGVQQQEKVKCDIIYVVYPVKKI